MSVSCFFSCHVGLPERNREIVSGVTYDDENQQRWYPFLWRKETEYNIFYVFERVKVGSCACGFVYSESIELRCQLSPCPFSEDTPWYSYEHVRCRYRSWFNMFWHDLGQWNHRIDHVASLSSSSKWLWCQQLHPLSLWGTLANLRPSSFRIQLVLAWSQWRRF